MLLTKPSHVNIQELPRAIISKFGACALVQQAWQLFGMIKFGVDVYAINWKIKIIISNTPYKKPK